ncbi:sensor histidine kinase [Streptomyces sp. NPDC002690]
MTSIDDAGKNVFDVVTVTESVRAADADHEKQPPGLLAHRQAERQRRYAMTLQHGVQERMIRALLGLSMARQELGTVPSGALDLLHDAARDLEEALAGVREVTDALSPGALRAGGLPAALTALARRGPVPMGFSGTSAERLPHLVETHLYLLVSEAVERAVEHGRAGRVDVSLSTGTSAVVEVVDDGGRPVGAEDLTALAALSERAAALGGTLRITHAPGTGTTVTAVVPL